MKMQGIVITHRPSTGGLSNDLRLATVAKPEPRKSEVLIRVLSATIIIDDLNIAEGTALGGIPIAPVPSSKKPVTPGVELSGVVESVAANVTKFKVGDSVFGYPGFPIKRNGAWAEYCCVKEGFLIQKPDRFTHAEAAAFATSGMVSSAIIETCNLRKHHRVLVIGASGGVGTLVLQMAKQRGATVVAVCSKKNEELVKSLGADMVIDYTSASFVEVLGKESGDKMDFVVDLVGGKEIERDAKRVLKRSGEFLTIVGPVRYVGDQRLGWMGIVKLLLYIGWRMFSSLFTRPKYRFVAPLKVPPFFMEVLETSSIKPVVDKIVGFNEREMREAVSYVRTHRASGKVVISIGHA